MNNTASSPSPLSPRALWTCTTPHAAILAVLGVAFIAYFRHFGALGLYGDDPAFFGGLIGRDWRSEWDQVWFSLSQWPQGRPLGMGINLNLLPYVVFRFGGLPGLHLFAFLIVALNSALLHRLLRDRCTPLAALGAAGFYVLAPADTVQNSLVYAYNFELAALCGFVAVHAALHRRPLAFTLGLAGGLLMVEPVAMWALFVPLVLDFRPSRTWLWWAVRHTLNWVAVLAVVFVARKLIGDPWGGERVGEMASQPWTVLRNGLESASNGPWTYLKLTAERVVQPWRELDAGLAGVLAVCAALLALGWRAAARSGDPLPSSPRFAPALRLVIAGAVAMFAVYLCYFRSPWHPATWQTGFMSGVHLLAALGASLIFGGLLEALRVALPARLHVGATGALLAVLTSLAGFGELVQRDYLRAWNFQRDFWQSYSRLCSDASDRTFVVVLDRNLPPSRFIELFSWCSEVMPNALFDYRPVTGGPVSPPAVILVPSELVQAIRQEGTAYRWKPTYYFMLPKTADQQPQAHNLIVLVRDSAGRWQRIAGSVAVDGGVIPLRTAETQTHGAPAHRSPLAEVYGLQ